MHPQDLRKYVIRPVLKKMGYYSLNSEEQMMVTGAQESGLGAFLHQIHGPAVGIFQMEPFTHDDIWKNYLPAHPKLIQSIKQWEIPDAYKDDNAKEMAGNLYYATAMARVRYLRVPDPIPDRNDLHAMAVYYKKFYNTMSGSATIGEVIQNYHKYVGGFK